MDFGTFRLPWGRRHALLVVLGYSRLLWLRFYRRQTMAVLTEALESAFASFGRVPRELLFDQMRSVVISDEGVAMKAVADTRRERVRAMLAEPRGTRADGLALRLRPARGYSIAGSDEVPRENQPSP